MAKCANRILWCCVINSITQRHNIEDMLVFGELFICLINEFINNITSNFGFLIKDALNLIFVRFC